MPLTPMADIAGPARAAGRGVVRHCLVNDSALVDPRRYGSAGRAALAAEVTRLLGVIGRNR
jgi:hypothetical protein